MHVYIYIYVYVWMYVCMYLSLYIQTYIYSTCIRVSIILERTKKCAIIVILKIKINKNTVFFKSRLYYTTTLTFRQSYS